MKEEINSACNFVCGELSEDNINDSEVTQEIDDNRAKLKDNRLVESLLVKMLSIYRKHKSKVRNFASFKRT